MDALAKRLKGIAAAKDAVGAGAKGFHDRVPFQGVEQDNDLYIGMKFAHLMEQAAARVVICHRTDQGHLGPSFDQSLDEIVGCNRGDRLKALASLQRVGQ